VFDTVEIRIAVVPLPSDGTLTVGTLNDTAGPFERIGAMADERVTCPENP
jgi:hypothetical protein